MIDNSVYYSLMDIAPRGLCKQCVLDVKSTTRMSLRSISEIFLPKFSTKIEFFLIFSLEGVWSTI